VQSNTILKDKKFC